MNAIPMFSVSPVSMDSSATNADMLRPLKHKMAAAKPEIAVTRKMKASVGDDSTEAGDPQNTGI